MKCPPGPVVYSACLHAQVEFLLGSALQSLPLVQRGMAIAGNGLQHLRPVGEEKSVANIEEDDAPLCHDSILPNARQRRDGVDPTDAVVRAAVTSAEKNCNIQLKLDSHGAARAMGFSPIGLMMAGLARSARARLSLHNAWRMHSPLIAFLVFLHRHARPPHDWAH